MDVKCFSLSLSLSQHHQDVCKKGAAGDRDIDVAQLHLQACVEAAILTLPASHIQCNHQKGFLVVKGA